MTPKCIIDNSLVGQTDDSTDICKYMKYEYFLDLINEGRLHLRRIKEFDDEYEGRPSQVEWDTTENSNVRGWYEDNQYHTFVTCFTIGSTERDYMWSTYSGDGNGIMFITTVARLKDQLKKPPCPIDLPTGYDGFTIGLVEYFEEGKVNLHDEFTQGISNVRHVFRKRVKHEDDQEFRVMMNPGSYTEEMAFPNNKTDVFVPVNLFDLIAEIRLKPGSKPDLGAEVKSLLGKAGLGHIPLLSSELPSPS